MTDKFDEAMKWVDRVAETVKGRRFERQDCKVYALRLLDINPRHRRALERVLDREETIRTLEEKICQAVGIKY